MEQKQKNKLIQKMTLRQLVWASSLLVVLLTAGFFLFFNASNVHRSRATMPGNIELVYFNAELTGGAVVFSWATDAEFNNDYFTVERSMDGIHFDELLKQAGVGNSTTRVYYSDMDENPVPGYSYYRLRQTGINGQSSYSGIETIKYKSTVNGESDLQFISIAPNPFSEKLIVSFILKTATTVDFALVNSSGQVVYKDVIQTNDGMTQYNFVDHKELPLGIYFITLVYNDKKIIKKIIKN